MEVRFRPKEVTYRQIFERDIGRSTDDVDQQAAIDNPEPDT